MALRRLSQESPRGDSPPAAPAPLAVERIPIEGATRLLTVERADDVARVEALYGPVEGSIVRVRPALGEDGEKLSEALLGAGAGTVRVEPGAVEGMPDLAAPDPDGTPRELALARARLFPEEIVGEVVEVVEVVERALTAAKL